MIKNTIKIPSYHIGQFSEDMADTLRHLAYGNSYKIEKGHSFLVRKSVLNEFAKDISKKLIKGRICTFYCELLELIESLGEESYALILSGKIDFKFVNK